MFKAHLSSVKCIYRNSLFSHSLSHGLSSFKPWVEGEEGGLLGWNSITNVSIVLPFLRTSLSISEQQSSQQRRLRCRGLRSVPWGPEQHDHTRSLHRKQLQSTAWPHKCPCVNDFANGASFRRASPGVGTQRLLPSVPHPALWGKGKRFPSRTQPCTKHVCRAEGWLRMINGISQKCWQIKKFNLWCCIILAAKQVWHYLLIWKPKEVN